MSGLEEGKEARSAVPARRGKGQAKARGMVLRWAILKAVGPDRWHFAALNDATRFKAYEGALQRAVTPGVSVVDIGAGAGLLSFVAEKLGAVVTRYERLRPVANLQMKMARSNGLRLRVLSTLPGEHSSSEEDEEKTVEADIALVEVWSPTLLGGQEVGILGHGLLAALALARKCGTIGPRTKIIPRRARLFAAPVAIPLQTELLRCPMGSVSGFDLSTFSRFCPAGAEPAFLAQMTYTLLAPPVQVLDLALNDPSTHPCVDATSDATTSSAAQTVIATAGGVCNAVAFWYEAELDDEMTLSTDPSISPATRQAVFMLPVERLVSAGDAISLTTTFSEGGEKVSFEVSGGVVALEHPPPGKQVVQRWHFGMLNDTQRNEAFYAALRNQVRGGDHVLDIGAGTGLLGMMAAKSGAAQVTCCEKAAPLARAAEEIVTANGLEGIVRIVPKLSSALTVGPTPAFIPGAEFLVAPGRDMAGKADVMVAEIVDCGLLGEGWIPSLLDARDRLLTPDATIIPCAAQVYAVALECPEQPAPLSRSLASLHGFDVSLYDQFRAASYEQIRLSTITHRALSEPQEVFDFDFYSPSVGESRGDWQSFKIEKSGTVHGIAFWFTLHLDPTVSLSTAPDNATTCWKQAVQFFDAPIQVEAGDKLPLWCRHDQTKISFSPQLPSPDDE